MKTIAAKHKITKGQLQFFDAEGNKIEGAVECGGSLYLSGTAITALPDNLTVGGYLDLSGTAITALPDNLTVGGYLDLEGTAITALPDNLTVGGYLYLEGTAITALPDNLTVGGYLYLSGTAITEKETKKVNRNVEGLSLRVSLSIEAKFNLRGFSIADGILGRILSKKTGVTKIETVGTKKIMYVVSDEKGNNAHGETIAGAMVSLRFKTADRDVTPYKGMPLDTVKSRDDWAIAYHIVTGACETGIKHFISQQPDVKEEYTLAEILALTKSAYQGSVFSSVVRSAA